MKKNLSPLFAVLIGLGAVFFLRRDSGPKMVWIYVQTELPALEGVLIQTEQQSYSQQTKSIAYIIDNQSPEEISGGEPGGFYYVRAEQWTEEGWRYWAIDPSEEGYAPAAVGFGLMPGSTSQEFSLPFREMLPEITPGRYRLAWDFETGDPDDDEKNYTVYQEFTVEP